MIEQAELWRLELTRIASRLENRYGQRNWSNRTRFNIEKDIFIAFFVTRKLLEAQHVGPSVRDRAFDVTAYPTAPGAVPTNNPKTFAASFWLTKGSRLPLSLRTICNQFIHSHVFSPFVPFGTNMVGVFFSSDTAKATRMHYMPLVNVIALIRSVAEDRPITLKVAHDGSKYVLS